MTLPAMVNTRTWALAALFLFLMAIHMQARDKREYLATRYGAVADGNTINTTAIQTLINTVSTKGGGTIVFPAGIFLTGTLQLKSNVDINISEGAVLLGSTNPDNYFTIITEGRPLSPKKDDNSQLALLVAHKANNVSIYGKGTIDGQGLALALHIDSLHHTGASIDPKYNYRRMRPNETARPKLFRFSECDQVTVSNLQLKNSACWGLSFELCTNLTLDSLTIVNRAYWNNDGIDITDCQHVRITNCDVNAADDGICLKSYYPGYSNNKIYIANCTIRSSASAIKFGTASYGGFKNVTIDNIKVFDTFRSAIAIESVDGAVIENIRVSNIVAKNTGNALYIRLGHRDGERPGIVRNIHISNIEVEVPFGRPDTNYDLRGPEVDFFHNPFPASIVGIPGHCIEDVVLEHITVTYPGRATKSMAYIPLWDLKRVPEKTKDYPEFSMLGELPAWGLYVRHAQNIRLNNISFKLLDADYRPAFVFDDVNQLSLTDIILEDAGNHPQFIKNDDGKLTYLQPENN